MLIVNSFPKIKRYKVRLQSCKCRTQCAFLSLCWCIKAHRAPFSCFVCCCIEQHDLSNPHVVPCLLPSDFTVCQQQHPFFYPRLTAARVHVSVFYLWFRLFQEEASPPLRPSPDLSRAPRSLCSGDSGLFFIFIFVHCQQ